MRTIHAVAAAAALCGLAACGGGGGGGGVREVPFTSFPAAPNQTVVMTGISETIGGTNTGGGTAVTSIDASSVMNDGASTARITIASNGDISRIAFSTPQSSVSLGGVDCSTSPTCAADNSTSLIVAINPAAAPPFFGGWHYQTYGVWLQQTGPTTFTAGAMSAGAVTPGTAVPTTGSGIFSGLATGFYVNSGGAAFATAADMSAIVTFSSTAPSIDFSTSNTTINAFDGTGIPTAASQLNITGTLIYPPGTSQFAGPVTTGSGMTGNAAGRFYGPAAQEMGGVYSLTGTALERMVGAFGGRQP